MNLKAKSIMTLLVHNVLLGLTKKQICVNNHRTHIKAYVLVACHQWMSEQVGQSPPTNTIGRSIDVKLTMNSGAIATFKHLG